MTSTTLSQKQLNFARFSIACIDINKLPLKDILTIFITPLDLKKEIKKRQPLLTGEYKLNPDQRKKCYYNSNNSPDYSTFDITLLYKLIRNLCPSLEPTKKWGNKPTVNDLDVGDDIERIRYLRNSIVAHSASAEISDDEYNYLWSDVKCIIQRCQQYTLSNGCTTDYNKMVQDLERKTFTFDEYTFRKARSGAICVFGEQDVFCGKTACFEADISLEQDVYLPVIWNKVAGKHTQQLDIEDDKYKGSDNRKLLIHNVCFKDEAGYQAVLARDCDVNILSNKVYLRPKGDLPFLKELNATSENKDICIHYVFKVSENMPVKDIKWTKNNSELEVPSDKYRGGGVADNCLTILRATDDDKGLYTCTVRNAVGAVSKSMELDEPSAKILSTSNSKVVCGSDTKFDCIVSGHPPPKVEWQNSHDGTEFVPIDADPVNIILLQHSLIVQNATVNHQQYYRVVASNNIGTYNSNQLFLQVTGNLPNMSEVTCFLHGNSVKLKCDVFVYEESPALDNVYWTKDGRHIVIATNNGKYTGADKNDPSLTINSVNHNDAGDYQLIAVNAVGENRSKVIVLGLPEVLLKTCEKKEDGSLWFTMTIKSVPVPHAVQWSMNENPFETFQPINTNASEYEGTTITFPHPVLVIKHSKKLESCSFEIQVKNRIGEVKRKISGETIQDMIKEEQKTVGKLSMDGGSHLPFSFWLMEMADKFPIEKIKRLKSLIQLYCKIPDDTKLEKAQTAEDCFLFLWREKFITPSDVIAMQFLLKGTKDIELEKECIKFAKETKALHYFEKPPENGYINVRFHVLSYHCLSTEDETKLRETVANIVGCSIKEVRVHGYLYSSSIFIVLSIKEIYIKRLFAIQQHDKDELTKLNIDYFKDDFDTVRLDRTSEVKDKYKITFDHLKGSFESSKKSRIFDKANPDEIAVTRLFIYLKNTLDIDNLEDYLLERNLFSGVDDEYVLSKLETHYRCERLIKQIIKNGLCTKFVALLREIPEQTHVYDKIEDFKKNEMIMASTGDDEIRPPCTNANDLLQRHFKYLYMELEPRDIADELLQKQVLSIDDHDDIKYSHKKCKRLENLLDILNEKQEYTTFWHTLKARYSAVWNTLQLDNHQPPIPSEYAVCIQHNFTTLQEELPPIDVAICMLKQILDRSNISDIEKGGGRTCQKSKLIKIILMKGMPTCEDFVTAIQQKFERTDFVRKMEMHNDDVIRRGKPALISSLSCLAPSCLQERRSDLCRELEPLRICDLLLEERAVDIVDHDKITETKGRQNQSQRLIEILEENNNDCFHYFLHILYEKNYATILKILESPTVRSVDDESDTHCEWKISHTVQRLPDDALNEPIDIILTFYESGFGFLEEYLNQHINPDDAFIREEVLTHGQMDMEDVRQGSIVLRLRPITDQAVQNLLNAKKNNNLVEMICAILKQVHIEKMVDETTPITVGIQIIYSYPASDKPDDGMSKTKLIQNRVTNYRDVFVNKLEPKRLKVLLTRLSQSNFFHNRGLFEEKSNCYERFKRLLSLFENGSSDDVNLFVSVLKDLGYYDILELIEPTYVHLKAERIRKMIFSNFGSILDEMQMTLAMETLSECIGNVDEIKQNIMQVQNTRRQRMFSFLRFILQNDHNVVAFEKMLERNGLEDILKEVEGEDTASREIEMDVTEDPVPVPADGILFESVITLSYTDGLDERTVRRLFVFLKENIIFNTLQDELNKRNFFPDNESKEYVFGKTDENYKCERFLKLIIKKKRCRAFIACIGELPVHSRIFERIQEFQEHEANTILNDAKKGPELACSVNDKLLQHHFGYLFTELEPREIADEMFQAGHFSTSDHDYLADLPNRHKRLKSVLNFLERKHLHAPFLDVMKSLHHASVIATLQTERQFIPKPSTGTALSIQHNFTVLLEELPDQAIHIMKHVLTHSDRSDIKQFKSVFRQKAKLLKIVLRNRDYACKELFNTISLYFRRDDLIQAMETKSARMLGRGRPVLNPSLSLLSTSCLRESSDLFEDELEPIRISDLLFEERAVDILDHDRITRIVSRREQIKVLLDTVKKNKEDCFHFFLYILQNDFEKICNELNKPTFAAPRVSMFDGTRSLTYEVARAQGDVQNKDIKVHLSLSGRAGSQIERELIPRICSDVPDILEEIIAHGQMDVLYVTTNPVVLQLTPLTDDAVHTLLNAKENKRLLNMIFGILKTAITVQQFDTEKSCQIRVQVYYANSGPSNLKSGISRTIQIKDLLRVHRNKLQFELEPTQVISALSKSKAIQKGSLHCASSSCTEKINGILSMVKDGSTDLVESFVKALKDLGYRDIVELIDPTDVHTKAEDIRKSITSNYRNILDEMQITLANETLAKCIGYVHDVKNKLSQKNSSRHQRMNAFLRFIVKDDHNVIEFARVLENNGLEELLRCKHDVHVENIPVQDIEMMVVDDYSPPSRDGVLLDSLITLAYGDKAEHIGPWAENIESGDLRQLFGSFCIKIPEDPDGLSFTKDILGESKLAEFVEEIRYLARNVVLYKYLRDEEKKPGTVYVYEVNVKYTANQVVIDDKDARQKLDFFQRKNQNLVKVILIKGGFHSILQAKKKAYQKYKQYFNFERFHLHHESEEYTEVAKLSAHRKAVSYKEFVESVRDSIPLQNIEKLVKDAVNRAFSKESITELCFDVVIQESGNTNSDPYYCRSGSTVNKLKEELMRKTMDSVGSYLGTEICKEIQKHIQTEIQSKLSIDTELIYTVLNFSKVLFLEAVVTTIGYILNPLLGALFLVLSFVYTLFFAVNVNSRSWRRAVANQIYKQVDKNKEKVVTELSSNIRTRCKKTADHLKLIADLLEEFTSSIDLNDQDTRSWEES